MFKNCIYIVILILSLLSNQLLALNSSSYLIGNTAIKLFDFEKAYSHLSPYKDLSSEEDLYNKLLILVNLNLLSEANNVAKKLININEFNQEAWTVYLTYSLLNSDLEAFNKLKKISQNNLPLIDIIFFDEEKKLKKNKLISRKIYELIETSYIKSEFEPNYNFLLFYLSIAIFLDSEFDEAYYFSAFIYQTLGKYNKAENLYNKINSSHTLFIDSKKNIAINKSKLGFYLEGEEFLFDIVNNYKNEETYHALADFYRLEKKYNKAILYYSKALDTLDNKSKNFWHLLYLRGICYEKNLNWKMAEKDFLYSLKINPDSPQVLNYLAYGWLERNINLNKSLKMLKKAYAKEPDSYFILDSLAWAYFKKNELLKAAQLMEQVIEMAPGEAISLDHLGDIYFEMERKREALYFWQQALDLSNPQDNIDENLKKKIERNSLIR